MNGGGGIGAGTPSLLRAINERTVLESVRSRGPVSRAQIARDSGLSKPTVSQALTSLLRSRLVREAGRSSGGKGPTAVLYELNPRAGLVVGLDVGPDKVRAAIADLTGAIVARRDERARTKTTEDLITQIAEMAHGLAGEAGIRWGSVTFATVGSPGVFLPERGRMALAHNLPGWGRQGLVEHVTRKLGTNVGFENDVNLAAIGERWHGLGIGVRNFVFLHVGTGIGMGLVLEGELYRGSSGAAGEVGYLPISTIDPRDRASRRHGALELGAGARALADTARSLGMSPPLSPRRIFASARRGDPVALKAVEAEAGRIALAVAAIVPVVDPELVILGGSVGANGDLLIAPLERELRELSPFRPRIQASALGEDATLHGAVATALRAAQEQLFARPSPRRTPK